MRPLYWSLLFVLIQFPISPLHAATVFELPVQSLPQFIGKDPAKLRAYAGTAGGGLTSVPFQADSSSAALGVDDRILWMSSDMGPRVDPGKWPSSPFRYEVAADAPNGKVIYLSWEENPSPPSSRAYLRYDAAQDVVESEFYQIGFLPGKPLIQDRLVLKSAAQPRDILDRFKVRLKLAIKNFFDFNIDEGEISSQIVKVRTGPIRVVRSVSASKKIGPIKLIPKSRMDFYFYPDWVEVKTQIVNPVDGPKILDDTTSGISGFDLNAAVYGSRFTSDLGGSLSLDGKPDAAEAGLAKQKLRWWSFSGPAGAMVVQVRNDERLSQMGVEPAFLLIDDSNRAAAPESEKGGTFLGFDLPYHKIPKGEYQVRVLQVFPKDSPMGKEESLLKEAKIVIPQSVRFLP